MKSKTKRKAALVKKGKRGKKPLSISLKAYRRLELFLARALAKIDRVKRKLKKSRGDYSVLKKTIPKKKRGRKSAPLTAALEKIREEKRALKKKLTKTKRELFKLSMKKGRKSRGGKSPALIVLLKKTKAEKRKVKKALTAVKREKAKLEKKLAKKPRGRKSARKTSRSERLIAEKRELRKKLTKARNLIKKLGKRPRKKGRMGKKSFLLIALLKKTRVEKRAVKKELTKACHEAARLEERFTKKERKKSVVNEALIDRISGEKESLAKELKEAWREKEKAEEKLIQIDQVARRLKELLVSLGQPVKDFVLPRKEPSADWKEAIKTLSFVEKNEVRFCDDCLKIVGVPDDVLKRIVEKRNGLYVNYENRYCYGFAIFRQFLEDNHISTYHDYLEKRSMIESEKIRDFYPEIPEEIYNTVCFAIAA
jgi:hypothetical protein